MTSPRLSGTQSPPPDTQHPYQAREPPSSGHAADTDRQHQTQPRGEGGLAGLESNPKGGGPLERFVAEKTGTVIRDEEGRVGEGGRAGAGAGVVGEG